VHEDDLARIADPPDVFSHIWTAFDNVDLLAACAWCGRVQIDGQWIVPPPAALAAIDARNALSHSICEACAQRRE
jgi:hypothetical protein